MKYNKAILVLIISLALLTNFVFAGCGNCQSDTSTSAEEKIVSSTLVTSVPKDGAIEGLVIASCGMCTFGSKKLRSCSLFIKIDDEIYPVKGTSIKDHGDMHAKEGFCMASRIAYVSGKINKGEFYADTFQLIISPKL